MIKYWALVANNSNALIYEIIGRKFTIIEEIDNPDGRLKNGDFTSDRAGRTFSSTSNGRSALGTEVDPKTHLQHQFASYLVEMLRKAKLENKFDELILVAPSGFIGRLNGNLPEILKKCLKKQISKDLPSTMNEQERVKRLCDYLGFWG